jgi:hypothetical protein
MGLTVVVVQTIVSTIADEKTLYNVLTGFAPPKYFLSVISLLIVVGSLPTYVAHGVTRRRTATSAALFAALATASFVILSITAITVNLALAHKFDVYAVSRIALAHLLTGYAYMAAGWMIGAAYYRYGPWIGTLLLPLTTLPGWVADISFTSLWTDNPFTLSDSGMGAHLAFPVAVLIGVANVIVALAGGYAIVRTMPIRARRA